MKNKKMVGGILFVLILMGVLLYATRRQDFDAKGYVEAVLNANLKGDVTQAASMIEAQDETELLETYEAGIDNFLQNYILSGAKPDDTQMEQYRNCAKTIFSNMEYEVKSVKKLNTKKMQVTVAYRESDVLEQFVEKVAVESENFLATAKKTKYKGTEEQIRAQMEKEFLNRSVKCLTQASESANEGEEKEMIFVVKGDKNNIFYLENTQISQFIAKILCIDEIQD